MNNNNCNDHDCKEEHQHEKIHKGPTLYQIDPEKINENEE